MKSKVPSIMVIMRGCSKSNRIGAKMKIKLGPLLNLRTFKEDSYSISILYVLSDIDKLPKLNYQINSEKYQTIDGIVLSEYKSNKIIRYDLRVALTDSEQTVTYYIDDEGNSRAFTTPIKQVSPRMAFASCNGFSSAEELKKVKFNNNMWRKKEGEHKGLLDKHDENPLHILLLGGDQIYADSIWVEIEELRKYIELDYDDRVVFPVPTELDANIEDFYFNLYLKRWAQEEIKTAYSEIPCVMMWDDHDIIDGWGSHNKPIQDSALFRTIYKYALKYFRLFQMHLKADERHPSSVSSHDLCLHFSCHEIGVCALDLRSNRTIDQVIHPKAWSEVKASIFNENLQSKHLLVMSSIPFAHPDLSWIDTIAEILLPESKEGSFELMDDLRDHWNSRSHRAERLKMIHNFFDLANSKKTRVTILSGDVHVAAMGVITSNRNKDAPRNAQVINQLTSSGIVHPGPPSLLKYFYELISKGEVEIDRGVHISMNKLPGVKHRFSTKRNWLAISPDDTSRVWVELWLENEQHPYLKVVHEV